MPTGRRGFSTRWAQRGSDEGGRGGPWNAVPACAREAEDRRPTAAPARGRPPPPPEQSVRGGAPRTAMWRGVPRPCCLSICGGVQSAGTIRPQLIRSFSHSIRVGYYPGVVNYRHAYSSSTVLHGAILAGGHLGQIECEMGPSRKGRSSAMYAVSSLIRANLLLPRGGMELENDGTVLCTSQNVSKALVADGTAVGGPGGTCGP